MKGSVRVEPETKSSLVVSEVVNGTLSMLMVVQPQLIHLEMNKMDLPRIRLFSDTTCIGIGSEEKSPIQVSEVMFLLSEIQILTEVIMSARLPLSNSRVISFVEEQLLEVSPDSTMLLVTTLTVF